MTVVRPAINAIEKTVQADRFWRKKHAGSACRYPCDIRGRIVGWLLTIRGYPRGIRLPDIRTACRYPLSDFRYLYGFPISAMRILDIRGTASGYPDSVRLSDIRTDGNDSVFFGLG